MFFPTIYFLGWILISPLAVIFPFLETNKSLYGTLITFILFLVCLPFWSKSRWGKNIINTTGLSDLGKNKKSNILFEFLLSSLIVLILALFIQFCGYAEINLNISFSILLNSLFLGLFVGIAEELVFRIWLYEELRLIFNAKFANLIQALIFALAHIRFNFQILSNFQLFIGLFLLALYLNSWRRRPYQNILLPICFHGTIVGLWFFINNAILSLSDNIPKILFGPSLAGTLNPIGGSIAIIILLILNLFQNSIFDVFLSANGRTLRDSSKDDLP